MAFAYFVYQADKILTETAEKRLQAMKEFAELGVGFKIAMRASRYAARAICSVPSSTVTLPASASRCTASSSKRP